jgi:2-dehydro-3-deoxyphosphogluconate aldolase/(4S)-4-hydroxy-2-oxoglutarate aldolase
VTAADLRAGPVAAAIRAQRLIVVLRRIEPVDRLVGLVDELVEAGARIFEITFDAPSAANDVRAVRAHLASRAHGGPFLVGAGTVTRADQLEVAVAAGADFGVAPLLDPDLVAAATELGLPFVPGALTPTEIARAWTAGATLVKVFPASAVGPSFVRELRGPMPEVGLVPTGGVDGSNAAAFLEAGAAAVGIGSALTKAEPAVRRALVASIAEGPR